MTAANHYGSLATQHFELGERKQSASHSQVWSYAMSGSWRRRGQTGQSSHRFGCQSSASRPRPRLLALPKLVQNLLRVCQRQIFVEIVVDLHHRRVRTRSLAFHFRKREQTVGSHLSDVDTYKFRRRFTHDSFLKDSPFRQMYRAFSGSWPSDRRLLAICTAYIRRIARGTSRPASD